MADDDDVRNGAPELDDPASKRLRHRQKQLANSRDAELCERENIRKAALEIYRDVETGFQNQWERSNDTLDYWDIYNCELSSQQFYSGTSKIYVPIVHDAVNSRRTRFTNQLFPRSGRHVEVLASEESKPHSITSLLEHYIRKTRIRTSVAPALLRNGDVEGQYNLLVGWVRNERHVVMKIKKGDGLDGLMVDGDETYEDIQEETIIHQYPSAEVLPDNDVCILPATAGSVEEAIDNGGSATYLRRWSKSKLRTMIRDGEIEREAGEMLIKEMSRKSADNMPDKKKKAVDAAGIKMEGGGKHALCYVTWVKLNVDGERLLCKIIFGGEDNILSVKRNPFWCDKCPLLSAPVDRVEGSFKGVSKIKPVQTMQYQANDAVNEGMDSAAYALLPIVMTDPVKNPRVGSMVLNVAAIWETNPNDTKFAQFPPLWKDAFQIVQACKEQVHQTLGVNPAMIPQGTAGKKQNQAQIANEQQVDLLTTADAVTTAEGEIFTPMLQWFVWLDHQFRDEAVTVKAFGKMGVDAIMDEIEPIQMDRRFEFRWFGVEAARNQQEIQMQLSGLNVLRNIPPQSYAGYELNLVPVITQFVENVFGPRLAPLIFRDIRHKMTLNAELENSILESGMPLPVSPMDEDKEHMQAHMKYYQEHGDPHGTMREHMMRHGMQLQQKQMQAQMQQQQQAQGGAQGAPQGGGSQPRPGAMNGPSRGGQGPPGMIHADRMHVGAPRGARG